MPRFKLTIAYDGTAFHGWQKQEPPDGEPLRTVQGVVEQTARIVLRDPVNVDGASRTDTGVHARGQVAAFTTMRESMDAQRIARALNSRLPDDVLITRVDPVHDGFNPIADCLRKGYRYTIKHACAHGALRPLFDRHFVMWSPYVLESALMHAAAQHLVGQHDFASFTRVHHGKESTVRTVEACEVRSEPDHRIVIDVSGPGFLYNMVRIIAGTLLEVGRGAIQPDDMPSILAARDRAAAGPTLPPQGLCLEWIEYGDHLVAEQSPDASID